MKAVKALVTTVAAIVVIIGLMFKYIKTKYKEGKDEIILKDPNDIY